MLLFHFVPIPDVIHTVGPQMHFFSGRGVDQHKQDQLASCYQTCLNIVLEHNRKHREIVARQSAVEARAEAKESVESTEESRKDTETESKTKSDDADSATDLKSAESSTERDSQQEVESDKKAGGDDQAECASSEGEEGQRSVEEMDVRDSEGSSRGGESDEDSENQRLETSLHQVEPLIDSIAFPCISTGIYGKKLSGIKISLKLQGAFGPLWSISLTF